MFQATTKPLSAEYDDEVIMTSVGFADRQASLQAAVEFDTDKAIADLYAHVAQMPDSACKRRLMKQVGGTYSDSHFTPPLLQSIFSLQKSIPAVQRLLQYLQLIEINVIIQAYWIFMFKFKFKV